MKGGHSTICVVELQKYECRVTYISAAFSRVYTWFNQRNLSHHHQPENICASARLSFIVKREMPSVAFLRVGGDPYDRPVLKQLRFIKTTGHLRVATQESTFQAQFSKNTRRNLIGV
jgi:hypothetical protein